MSGEFQVGDVVVRTGPSHLEAPRGVVARVLAVYRLNGSPAIDLTIKPIGNYQGWCPSGWRKLNAPHTEIADRIRACRPADKRVPA